MIFCQYLKLHTLIVTVFGCRLPLGLIDTPCLNFLEPSSSFSFGILNGWFTLSLWLDFDDELLDCLIRLSNFHIKIWKITVQFTIPWR